MLSERLKELRKNYKITQTEMAKKLNISQPAYGDWERGKFEPSPEKLKKLSEIFNVSVDYLLGNTNKKNNDLESTEILFRTTVDELELSPEEQEVFKKEINEFIEQRRKAFKE